MEPYPIKPTMPTSAEQRKGGYVPALPEGEGCMRISIYIPCTWNLVSAQHNLCWDGAVGQHYSRVIEKQIGISIHVTKSVREDITACQQYHLASVERESKLRLSAQLVGRRRGTSILLCWRHDYLQSDWQTFQSHLISWCIQEYWFVQYMQYAKTSCYMVLGVSTACR
jgi:hypothetical protein